VSGGAAAGVPASPASVDTASDAEEKARVYFDKAAEFESSGEVGKALRYYRKAVEGGETRRRAAAQAQVVERSASSGK
jgi:hypothetical protein